MYSMKKVMAIHDMSCYGRASLTSIIPIISVMGIQVCPFPTAILSTHTGGYGKPEVVPLDDFMQGAKNHWSSLNLEFESIYTGYLASSSQVRQVSSIIDSFSSENQVILIDPVMADEGELYSGFTNEIISSMRDLIQKATIITPNITEAAFLLDTDYNDRLDIDKVNIWATQLADISNSDVAITSAPSVKGGSYIDTVIYDKKLNLLKRISVRKIDKHYPGTGDAFASVLLAYLLKGESLEESARFASEFISKSIKLSSQYDYDSKEGILLEKSLKLLI